MTALAADLLRALRGAGYNVGLNEDRLNLNPPALGMSPALRDRIAEHRDALKALLRSDDPFTACTPCDADLQAEEPCRSDADRLAARVAAYLDRYVATGNAVDIEIAAWFATAHETQRHLAEHDHQMPPPDEPDAAAEMAPDSSGNDRESFGKPPDRLTIYVCTGCGLPRSRRPEPCPSCGALCGRNHYPNAKVT